MHLEYVGLEPKRIQLGHFFLIYLLTSCKIQEVEL